MTNREHDKGPEEFCSILTKLIDANLEFVVSVLGEHTNDVPGIVWDSSRTEYKLWRVESLPDNYCVKCASSACHTVHEK